MDSGVGSLSLSETDLCEDEILYILLCGYCIS